MVWRVRHPPRLWQTAASAEWRVAKRGVVSVVTGGGKTIFAAQCICDFMTEHPKGRVFVVVPTTALLDQWVVDLRDELELTEDQISTYSGDEKSPKKATINIIVINSARNLMLDLTATETAFLIVDECHRAGSERNAQALRGSYVATLGLSATPTREYDNGFEERVVPVLGPIIFEYGYPEASQDSVIAKFKLINVQFLLLEHEQKEYDRLTARIRGLWAKRQSGANVEETLKGLLMRRASVSASSLIRVPLSIKLVLSESGQRTVVFHERVSAAEKILKGLRQAGVRACSYHTDIPPDIRRNNLWLYRRGLFDVLVCCRALDEGMNVPETSVAVIASSTASHRQRIQRLGRVLRPAPGKSGATIYTLFGTPAERDRLIKEEAELSDIAEISWLTATVPSHV